ncbi:hypothetical protein E2C01_086895 [Portunus trituberculatus]|uniref:Uncharacterized protein n=1 Tax=Portunus trituberculatus TaxID=210409 RepID=A0A5B7JCM6_PORTR|nr:hypothetical protein [Portunus trituberculatus]
MLCRSIVLKKVAPSSTPCAPPQHP